MSFYKLSIISISTLALSFTAMAKPPEPEEGKRWVINNAYSDEFNGKTLDQRKWRDHHRSWKGRPPAIFDPTTVSLKNGNLQIKNKMLEKPQGPYTISGGAVQSLNQSAYHGYYESKFKASRINMSTTFWLSNDSVPFKGKNYLGEECAHDSWSMELDIVEAVGGVIDAAFGKSFRTGHQYNTHVWYRGCDKSNRKNMRFSKGANAAEGDGSRPFNNKLADGKEVWQDYNTYAAWWKNENEVDFYLNDGFAGRTIVDTALLEKPYNRPMQMQMLTETYNWGTPYPVESELANDEINTSYYDWVRSYYYADVDADVKQEVEQVGGPDDIFTESVNIKRARIVLNTLAISYLYESDKDVLADIYILKGNKTLLQKSVNLKAGYGHVLDKLTLNSAAQFDGTDVLIVLKSNKGKEIVQSKKLRVKLGVK